MQIVHVEDDKPLKDILKAALQARDPELRLVQYTHPDDALHYIQNNIQNIDLFILDIRLPGAISGLELARKIRDMKYTGSIVLTSAYSRPNPDLLQLLDCEYYPKPWHLIELTQKVLLHHQVGNKAPANPPANGALHSAENSL